MPNNDKFPFYAKFSFNVLTVVLLGTIIFLGQDILMPLCFAIVLALLLLPINKWLVKKGLPQVPSMIISILIAVMLIGGIVYFLSTQVAQFTDDLPKIRRNLDRHVDTLQQWIREKFNISRKEQQEAIESASQDMKTTGPGMLGTTFVTMASLLILLFLLPIYTFLILYYRELIRKFFLSIFADRHRQSVQEVLHESRIIIQSYMLGLLIEMAIVAALNTTGFLLIGIEYAIFLAVLAAILNMIPYVGMLVAGAICILITLANTNDFSTILWVVIILTVVQFIDNNILMPYVVSSKVKINALVSILGVLIGGALAGVSGMFLSIPGIAIMKAVFDRVEGLQPWGMMLGDDITMAKPTIAQRIRKRIKKT
jgi:predicted PurR-regulated permease PerM